MRQLVLFGYVKPFKGQLKMCEFDAYKAVYCGLCGQLGKSFGPAARATLSYDFTFLCMLHHSVSGSHAAFEKRRCFVNPLKKQLTCQGGEELGFAADTAVIMLYYKLLDHMRDGGIISKLSGGAVYPAVGMSHKKASAARPECEKLIADAMKRQTELERRSCDSVDEAAQPTADALAGICALLGIDADTKRVLDRLGYFVGRYVYLCDALDDLEKDISKGGYNPFALSHRVTKSTSADELDKVYTRARESLYATIAECAKAYALLEPGPFHPILLNIFSMGMHNSVSEILSKKEKNR